MSHDLADGGLAMQPTSPDLAPPTCRACGCGGLEPILSLGSTPLANRLLTEVQLTEPEPTYPLDLVMCPACSLVQITTTIPPQDLFSEYPYFSSFSDTMLTHANDLVQQVRKSRRLGKEHLVIEIASNDGYLLQYYQKAGIPVLGIEPAANVARVARERHHIPTLTQFFNRELAERLVSRRQQADVLHANNVLAHVADLPGFIAGIATLLKPNGVAVMEVPYVKDLIDRVEFDTIYHEHLCYFSLSALVPLLAQHGLTVVDAEHVEIHGGSLRLFVARDAQPNLRVLELLTAEHAWGVDRIETYRQFGQRVEALRGNLVNMLTELKQSGKRIAVYGASAKGSTLLNYFGLGAELLDFVVDRSPIKQGYFTPGTHLRIFAPEKLLADQPDYCLLLSWNFAEEILQQQTAYRHEGGQFIIPIPELKVA